MYHFPNQQVYNDFQAFTTSFYGANAIEPAANINNIQNNDPGGVTSHPTVNLQVPQASDPLQSDAKIPKVKKARKTAKAKSAVGKEADDTSNFTVEQRAVAAVWVHERLHTNASMGQIKMHFEQRFGRSPPAKNTLLMWERKLFASGSVIDAPRPGRPARRKLLLAEVRASLRSAPTLSVRARAAALRVPFSTLQALLRRDLPLEVAAAQSEAVPVKKKRTKRPPREPPTPAPPAPTHEPPQNSEDKKDTQASALSST